MYSLHVGDPYTTFQEGEAVCITTNGITKPNGNAVMGAGTARFARDVFKVDRLLGTYLSQYGNRAFYLGLHTFPELPGFETSTGKSLHLISFPTKHHWKQDSDSGLIQTSVSQLISIAEKFGLTKIYLPFPGGGHGRLPWVSVKPLLEPLDSRFVVYSRKESDFGH